MSKRASPPVWRARVAQWDMSHNAIPLALFAYTGVLQSFVLAAPPFAIPAWLWYASFFVSLAALAVCSVLTLLRGLVHPAGLSHDFQNPRLVNFFFLPAIIGAIALLTTPPFMRSYSVSLVGFYLLAVYQTGLVLYLFGEWLFKKMPTASIYPLVFMQTIAFFLLSILASTLRLPEHAVASLTVGTLLWLIVLITNFQHLSNSLSAAADRPAPTFFLFIAPPAQAVLAVLFLVFADDNPGEGFLPVPEITVFPMAARVSLYIDLFLYLLMFRLLPTWWKSKFSVAWWAYVFPLSAATCAVVWRYHTMPTRFFLVLSCIFFGIATFAVVLVAGCTVWAVWTGRLPKNPARESEFRDWWDRSFVKSCTELSAEPSSAELSSAELSAEPSSAELSSTQLSAENSV